MISIFISELNSNFQFLRTSPIEVNSTKKNTGLYKNICGFFFHKMHGNVSPGLNFCVPMLLISSLFFIFAFPICFSSLLFLLSGIGESCTIWACNRLLLGPLICYLFAQFRKNHTDHNITLTLYVAINYHSVSLQQETEITNIIKILI